MERLLAEYTDALVAERTAWRVVQAGALSKKQFEVAQTEWLAAAEEAHALARRLKEATTGRRPEDFVSDTPR